MVLESQPMFLDLVNQTAFDAGVEEGSFSPWQRDHLATSMAQWLERYPDRDFFTDFHDSVGALQSSQFLTQTLPVLEHLRGRLAAGEFTPDLIESVDRSLALVETALLYALGPGANVTHQKGRRVFKKGVGEPTRKVGEKFKETLDDRAFAPSSSTEAAVAQAHREMRHHQVISDRRRVLLALATEVGGVAADIFRMRQLFNEARLRETLPVDPMSQLWHLIERRSGMKPVDFEKEAGRIRGLFANQHGIVTVGDDFVN
jgi:hypothetical protein